MANDFVTVYAKTTGTKQRIPRAWLGIPSFAKQFNKTPRQRKADERSQTTVTEPVATPDAPANTGDGDTETPATGEPKE